AVKKAIAAAAAAGGGTIVFSGGTYLTGPIHLKSNMTLLVDVGTVLKFSSDFDDYLPMVRSRWEGTEVTNFSPLIYGDKVENLEDSPNTDGIDPESSRNVRISDSYISTGDDCIAIKSGRDAQGRRIGRPVENVTVTNCTMVRGHGGVSIGSEMAGGARRIVVSNCVFQETQRGIRIKTTRGRGNVVEDVQVSNIVVRDLKHEAFAIDMYYTEVPPEPIS